jgi:hypothetical protein
MKSNLNNTEKKILKKLNYRALLIVEFEKIMQEAKIPYNTDAIHELTDERIVEMIEGFDPKNQAKLRNSLK